MLKNLRKKLILLFTLTTSVILTVILNTVVLFSQKQMEANRKDDFTNLQHSIISNLRAKNIITHSWLAEMESKHNLILTIWDNGVEFTYKNFNIHPEIHKELNSVVTELSEKERIYLNIRPTSTALLYSSVFELPSTNGNRYYGSAAYSCPSTLQPFCDCFTVTKGL